ncbi:hypothetical protein PHMEG_00022709 [Phytophthora megakarya]|uniref:Eukaryotic/viral aspartic protease n=1 Tax=Phytophthora megakarya TaxID=4795 RepID=A0A225VK27_9STRA|nr:hypothetical protein PHMEG_00022709 [Phytophthora megakarya]
MRAIEIQANDSGSDIQSDRSSGSDSDIDSHRRISLEANEDVTPKVEKEYAHLDPRLPDRDHGHQDHSSKIHGNGLSVIGAHTVDPGSSRILGHPSDYCLFVCRGCGELHDMGKCPVDEFYNQIRQWFNPTKHMGMLPEAAEKMLN